MKTLRDRLLDPDDRIIRLPHQEDRAACIDAIDREPSRFRLVHELDHEDLKSPPPRTRTMLDRFFFAPPQHERIDVILLPPDTDPPATLATGPNLKVVTFPALHPPDLPIAPAPAPAPASLESPNALALLDAMLLCTAAAWDCGNPAISSVAEEYARGIHQRPRMNAAIAQHDAATLTSACLAYRD